MKASMKICVAKEDATKDPVYFGEFIPGQAIHPEFIKKLKEAYPKTMVEYINKETAQIVLKTAEDRMMKFHMDVETMMGIRPSDNTLYHYPHTEVLREFDVVEEIS